MPAPTLTTERLLLRPMAASDAEGIFMLRSNERVNQYINREPAQTIADAEAFINKVLNNAAAGTSYQWVLTLKSEARLIGTICLWNISEDRTTAELGYDLLPHYHGLGLMSEAVKSILAFGFQQANFHQIEAFTHSDNLPSRKLLEQHGFQLQPDRKDDDDPINVIYELTRHHYQALH